MIREQIYNSLFQLLSGVSGIKTISRKLMHYSDVPASEQPALFMTVGNQNVTQTTGLPARYVLQAKVWIYTYTTDPSLSPSTAINNILDQIDSVFETPIVQDHQTLGGLVDDCKISGEILTSEGSLGDQEIATFPIEILITT